MQNTILPIFVGELLIWRSICWPLKRELMAFTVVQGTLRVWCVGEVKLNFSSRKVVLQLFPLKQEPTQESVDLVTDSLSDPLFDNFCQF